jgi:hypothetical protein
MKGSNAALVDTLYNGSSNSVNVTWNMKTSSTIAPGHVGIGLCFLPGQCYPFNHTTRTDAISSKSIALYQVDINISTASLPGEKSVVVLNTDINSGKDLVFILETASTQATNDLLINDLVIYPNPVDDNLQIKWENKSNAIVNVLNLQGLIIKSYTASNTNHMNLDLSAMTKGLYIVQINDDHGNLLASRKITK